ncbi:MAG: iron-sulfur cluster assembly protein [Chloroflexota bacterium]|nr:iron-sulfur cluster assembly protein [Chloroflexota bacterium]
MNDEQAEKLKKLIIARLRLVIDPETRADVVRMRLIEDLEVTADGQVTYTFRPSSPVCPIAVSLAQQIKQAVAQVPGVMSQNITVEGYVGAEQLTTLINR